MKVYVDWFVLCDQVIMDAATQQLTLVNCLDGVSAIKFPAMHPRFAFAARLRTDTVQHEATRVQYRFVRMSADEDEQTVATLSGDWGPNALFARVFLNFNVLRLKRAETLWFRLDWRLGDDDWTEGPRAPIVISQAELTPEQRLEFDTAMAKLRDQG